MAVSSRRTVLPLLQRAAGCLFGHVSAKVPNRPPDRAGVSRCGAAGLSQPEPECAAMTDQVHRSAASGSRSLGRVRPKICLNSREVCSRSNRRRNACRARSTSASASAAPVFEDHHTAGAARSSNGCSTASPINVPPIRGSWPFMVQPGDPTGQPRVPPVPRLCDDLAVVRRRRTSGDLRFGPRLRLAKRNSGPRLAGRPCTSTTAWRYRTENAPGRLCSPARRTTTPPTTRPHPRPRGTCHRPPEKLQDPPRPPTTQRRPPPHRPNRHPPAQPRPHDMTRQPRSQARPRASPALCTTLQPGATYGRGTGRTAGRPANGGEDEAGPNCLTCAGPWSRTARSGVRSPSRSNRQ